MRRSLVLVVALAACGEAKERASRAPEPMPSTEAELAYVAKLVDGFPSRAVALPACRPAEFEEVRVLGYGRAARAVGRTPPSAPRFAEPPVGSDDRVLDDLRGLNGVAADVEAGLRRFRATKLFAVHRAESHVAPRVMGNSIVPGHVTLAIVAFDHAGTPTCRTTLELRGPKAASVHAPVNKRPDEIDAALQHDAERVFADDVARAIEAAMKPPLRAR